MADISATRIIVLCLRWYLRYPLSYRNLQEMMTERELTLDHSTTARGVLLYAPVLNERIRLEMRWPNRSWGVCETYVRVAGTWTYLYRAIDSAGNTIDFLLSPKRDLTAAKAFLQLATFQVDARRPRVINVVDVAELFATLPTRPNSSAFPDRVTVLKVLASPAAISLENTQLYRRDEKKKL